MKIDIIDTREGRDEAISQSEHLINILNEEIEKAKKLQEGPERTKIIIGNGSIINSLEISIRALKRLNSFYLFNKIDY